MKRAGIVIVLAFVLSGCSVTIDTSEPTATPMPPTATWTVTQTATPGPTNTPTATFTPTATWTPLANSDTVTAMAAGATERAATRDAAASETALVSRTLRLTFMLTGTEETLDINANGVCRGASGSEYTEFRGSSTVQVLTDDGEELWSGQFTEVATINDSPTMRVCTFSLLVPTLPVLPGYRVVIGNDRDIYVRFDHLESQGFDATIQLRAD